MGRRSTAIGGGGLHQFWCSYCRDGFNTLTAEDWSDAEAQAARKGWRFTRSLDLCPRCA